MANRLNVLVRSGHQPSQLDLSNEPIKDVRQTFKTMEHLAQNLRTLTMRRTGLTFLPQDLSSFRALITLDIRDNPIRSASAVRDGLRSLPQLRYLYVTMPTEEEEDELVVALPNLSFLNGVELEDEPEALTQTAQPRGQGDSITETGLRKGYSHMPPPPAPTGSGGAAANTTFVPSLPSAAKNQDSNVQAGAAPPGLQRRQQQQSQLGSGGTQQRVPQNMPHHHSEGQTYVDDNISNTVDVTLSEGDLENTALVYGALKSIRTHRRPRQEQELTERFDSHMTDLMRGLSTNLKKENNTFLRQNEILQAKRKLPSECVGLLVDLVEKDMGHPTLAAAIRRLTALYDGVFDEYDRVSKEMVRCYQSKVSSLQSDVTRAESESAQLLEAAEALEQEAATAKRRNQQLEQYINGTAAMPSAASTQYETTTAQYAIPSEYRASDETQEVPQTSQGFHSRPTSTAGKESATTYATNNHQAAGDKNNLRSVPSNSEFHLATEARARRKDQKPQEESEKPAQGKAQNEAPPKTLSLNQLKDFIESIYASKIRFDAKCEEARLPYETLEQHMYTYLNQRYGLRSLILSYAAAIIRGVNTFSQADNDVRVFGCILRNEIDEDFRFVQRQLKDTVTELLKVHLKGRHPLKTDDAISQMIDEKIHGYVALSECSDIVRYMYSAEDANELMHQLETIAASSERGNEQNESDEEEHRREPPKRLSYNRFLKTLLDFQLRGHLHFLRNFRSNFREQDDDNDGIITHAQFEKLLQAIAPQKSKSVNRQAYNELIKQVDPFNSGRATFSQCVSALSPDLVSQQEH
eukprot:gb/GECG01013055.1/.p1 GENE.gb/GECG01013055.1/~~gb/GECG01013055.1/.p1  ORF type:complete len:808 (+),score=132.51 gb/GECG01013055.1/:1-2424(+)